MTFTAARSEERLLHHGMVAPMSPLADTCGMMQGWSGGAPAAVAWPTANLAIGYPFQVTEIATVYGAWYAAGGTAGGNLDIGIYDLAGNRVVSTGTTARTISAHTEITALTDTVLTPNHYYATMSADTTNLYTGWTTGVVGTQEAQGWVESASSFVLPSTITFSRTGQAFMPYFGFNFYSVAS